MKPEDAQAATPRKRAALPTQLSTGEVLADLALAELAKLQFTWKEKLAGVPLAEIELRAINAAIRKCAGGK